MREEINIQWFPGHMTKARRKIEADLSLVNVVLELLDSRIPSSSSNPIIKEIIGNKPRLVLLNKSDLADKNENNKWLELYKKNNIPAMLLDCKTGKGIKQIVPTIKIILHDEIERNNQRNMVGRQLRAMILGVPNVGKSTLINSLTSSSRAKVQDRPGVTRGNQWYKLNQGVELLDTPGVLWPKFESMLTGEMLAYTGAVRDEILDIEQLANNLLIILIDEYKELLFARYKLNEIDDKFPLESIAKKRGMMLPGGVLDTQRAAIVVLDEFRSGKIGHISLEKCDANEL